MTPGLESPTNSLFESGGDIGAKNMLVVTASGITSISNVISTGIVAELIIGSTEFVTPVLSELEVPLGHHEDEDEKKKNLVKDDEEAINQCEAV